MTTPAFTKLMMATLTTIASCSACVRIYPAVQVGPSFQVEVKNQGHPVEGLRVNVVGGQRVDVDLRRASTTNWNGLAFFRNLRPGSYTLSTDRDYRTNDSVEVNVKPTRRNGATVRLNWPGIAPIAVRSVNGRMRGPDYIPGKPQPAVLLELLEAISGRVLQRVQTSDSGEFSFEDVAPGLYFLDLKSGPLTWRGDAITGMIAVAVDRGAAADHLDLDLGYTSCGLWYADRSQCSQPDLNSNRLSGQVIDSTGAAIPRAIVLLLTRDNTLVERLQSDAAGNFALSGSLAGTYELFVSAPGFTPLRRTVRAESAGTSGRPLALQVQLGIGGRCSTTTIH